MQLWLGIIGEQQFRGNLLLNPRNKIRCGLKIEWNYDRAAQQTTVKSCDPLRTVLAPKQHAIARADLSPFELTRKLKSSRRETRIRPSRDPQPAPVDHGDLLSTGDADAHETS